MSTIPEQVITVDQLGAIAAWLGIPAPGTVPEPWVGAASRVYPLGDIVVKVPFDRLDTIEAVTTDAVISPYVHTLGVRAAELVAFDESREIVPLPFAIFRRIDGAITLDPALRDDATRAAWEDVGRQLARVHAVTDREPVPIALREFRQSAEVDPRPWVDELLEREVLSGADAAWLRALLESIAPMALADVPLALCHGDVNAANVLVHSETGQFRALIDWAGAGWLDPVWDFAGVSLDVVPWLLVGHREVAPLPEDATAEARIVWCQAQTRLHAVRGASDSGNVREMTELHVESLRRCARAFGLS
jgi:aminoglycoside phosphotransferase (APT) family kinase protein